MNSQYNIKKNLQWHHYISTKLYIYSILWVNMKTGISKYIGLATLAGISLTCDSNTKTLSSTIDNNKINIGNTFTPPLDTNNTTTWWNRKHISENTSPQIIDTLTQWNISHQQDIINKDTMNNNTMQIANIHSTNNIERWLNNNIVMWDTPLKENIKKILSKEECKDICYKQITKAIVEIVPETNKIKFDITYMRWEVYTLFQHFFTIEDTEDWTHIIFSKIQENDKIFVTQHMDNMKQHIKNKNGFWIKLLLTKWDLKDYIMNGSEEDEKSNIQKLYEIITNKWSIKYEWGELQFKKDIESVINLY